MKPNNLPSLITIDLMRLRYAVLTHPLLSSSTSLRYRFVCDNLRNIEPLFIRYNV